MAQGAEEKIRRSAGADLGGGLCPGLLIWPQKADDFERLMGTEKGWRHRKAENNAPQG